MKAIQRLGKGILAAAAAAVLCAALLFAGCSSAYVTGIENTGDGLYTVHYSDGSTTTFTVENGKLVVTIPEEIAAEFATGSVNLAVLSNKEDI